MKVLTLYIDKWYIIGAVCIDGVPRPITPPNGEDRFWLYFYEDRVNDTIVYGKDNKQHYHNNELQYYGNVFDLIPDTTASFIRYGRKQEMYKIFKASGILDELRDAVDENGGEVETYISFSKDISDAARLVFLKDVLEGNKFTVKESVARIGQLALELAFKKGQYAEDGFYVLLNACNENLTYSVYERTEGILLRKAEDSLVGMGTDLRGRALLESAVKSINQRQHFLDTEEDLEREYLCLNQYVDQWIDKLENAGPTRPVHINNIKFSQLPNTYDAVVLKADIDKHTRSIVDDIIREITNFINKINIPAGKLKGVVFLGNTFTNEQFIRAIKERYALPDKNYIFFKDSELPHIVAVYSAIDCDQFSEATRVAIANGETELERRRLAQEEEARRVEAERQRAEQEEKDRAAHESENKYKEAMANIYDYEKKQDYAQMLDWADIALQHNPDDQEAKQKKAEATRLMSEKKVKEEQYKSIIQRAQKSFEAMQWQEALSQSDAALNLMPNSKEAERIHQAAREKIDSLTLIEKYLTRADMFLAQQYYKEALDELRKVQAIDNENKEAQERIQKIEQEQEAHEQRVTDLIKQYQMAEEAKDFDTAISLCNELIDTDTVYQRKWTERVERLKAAKLDFDKEEERWQKLKRQIDSALFDEDWDKVVTYGHEALRMREDENLRKNVARAEEKLATLQAEKRYKDAVHEVKDFIVDKNWDEAKDLLTELQREYPEHRNDLKLLFKQIFDAETAFQSQTVSEGRTQPVRAVSNRNSQHQEDDFFGTSGKSTTTSSSYSNTVSNAEQAYAEFSSTITKEETQGDDFFETGGKATTTTSGSTHSTAIPDLPHTIAAGSSTKKSTDEDDFFDMKKPPVKGKAKGEKTARDTDKDFDF